MQPEAMHPAFIFHHVGPSFDLPVIERYVLYRNTSVKTEYTSPDVCIHRS